MATLPPDVEEKICAALGDAFEFADFDSLTNFCYGDRVINRFSYEKQPRSRIARDTIKESQRVGLLQRYLYICIQRDKRLTQTVGVWWPDALQPPPDLATQIGKVNDAIGRFASEEDVQRQLARSSGDLKALATRLSALTSFKGMHDAVHSLLLESLVTLLDDAENVAKQSSAKRLEEYVARLRLETANASAATLGLAEDERPMEAEWIGDLIAQADDVDRGIDTRDAAAISFAARMIVKTADMQATRLNAEIVRQATVLRLQSLCKTLQEIPIQSIDVRGRLDVAAETILTMQGLLLHRVAVHNRLQKILIGLVALADTLTKRDEVSLLANFAQPWPRIRRDVLDVLSRKDPGFPEAPRNIDSTVARVEAALLAIEAAETRHDVAERSVKVSDLDGAFGRFSYSVTLHFLEVDRALLDDLKKLSEINTPLQTLLKI